MVLECPLLRRFITHALRNGRSRLIHPSWVGSGEVSDCIPRLYHLALCVLVVKFVREPTFYENYERGDNLHRDGEYP